MFNSTVQYVATTVQSIGPFYLAWYIMLVCGSVWSISKALDAFISIVGKVVFGFWWCGKPVTLKLFYLFKYLLFSKEKEITLVEVKQNV